MHVMLACYHLQIITKQLEMSPVLQIVRHEHTYWTDFPCNPFQ